MSRKGLIILVIALVAVVLLIRLTMFEKKLVDDQNWKAHYELESKDPLGLYVFYNSLKSNHNVSTSPTLIEEDYNQLYIAIKPDNLSEEFRSDLNEHINHGAELLILSNNYFNLDSDIEFNSDYTYHGCTDSIVYAYKDELIPLIKETNYVQQGHRYREAFLLDSYLPIDSISFIQRDSSSWCDTLLNTLCIELGQGKVCYNSSPELFANYFARQKYYHPYINEIIDKFDNENICFLEMPEFSPESDSPLKHILSHRSLKYGYYMLFLTALLYITIGAKREERVVPVINPKENTIMEYVNTINLLHQKSDDYTHIARTLRENFYHYVEKRYFLTQNDEAFWSKLKQKSKIDQQLIAQLDMRLQDKHILSIDTYNEVKLLYNLTEKFKNTAI